MSYGVTPPAIVLVRFRFASAHIGPLLAIAVTCGRAHIVMVKLRVGPLQVRPDIVRLGVTVNVPDIALKPGFVPV